MRQVPANHRPWLHAVLYTALTMLALYPVLSVTVPPLVDYPNHLARIYVLGNWDRIPELRRNFALNWMIHPNMAMDILLWPLSRVLPIYDTGRLFIVLTFLMIVGGTVTLRKVLHGRVGILPILAYLVLYNLALYWGFLNYLFSAGLALFGFSFWIMARNRSLVLKAAAFTIFSVILFFAHLFGIFVYALLVISYELWRTRQESVWGRPLIFGWIATLSQFVLPGALFCIWVTGGNTLGQNGTYYGSLYKKLQALGSPVIFASPTVSIAIAAVLGAGFIWCWCRHSIGFSKELRYPVIVLALAALMMPAVLYGVHHTDIRLPPVIACVIVAGIRIDGDTRPLNRLITIGTISLMGLRVATIAYDWNDLDKKFAEFRSAIKVATPGSNLLVVQDMQDIPKDTYPKYGVLFWHMGALAVIERSIFNPLLFTGHTTINAAPKTKHLDVRANVPISREKLVRSAHIGQFPNSHSNPKYRQQRSFSTDWPRNYSYVLSVRFANSANPYPTRLNRIATGSFFDIYRVVRGPSPLILKTGVRD